MKWRYNYSEASIFGSSQVQVRSQTVLWLCISLWLSCPAWSGILGLGTRSCAVCSIILGIIL
ncbi:hypothetical protein BJX62DRAFT_206225 [Aspergillus germanicus]